jgi:hypothetical protein
MSVIDQRLESIAHQSLAVCRSVSDALSDVFSLNNRKGGVTLSLQSRYGTLVAMPSTRSPHALDICSHPLLKTLAADENEERIALLLGAEEWNMVSCFSRSGIAFYPVISIPAPPEELRWVRFEMLGALDCFSLNCKSTLSAFFNAMTEQSIANSAQGERKGNPERKILKTLTDYSANVESVALIDNDGFVLTAAGHEQKAEAIASSLALFHNRSSRRLNDLGDVAVRSLSLYDGRKTLLVGRAPGSAVSLALSIRGTNSRVIARFLLDAGLAALEALTGAAGTLDDYHGDGVEGSLRIRKDWLSRPRLAAKGAYVAVKEESVFHDPSCESLIDRSGHEFSWFAARADAIRSGLIPCESCNP